jgi:predicted AAA+ superfamily ATPase
MIERLLKPILVEALANNPAVAILGPRQVGKTTLALEAAKASDSVYLDLESLRPAAR